MAFLRNKASHKAHNETWSHKGDTNASSHREDLSSLNLRSNDHQNDDPYRDTLRNSIFENVGGGAIRPNMSNSGVKDNSIVSHNLPPNGAHSALKNDTLSSNILTGNTLTGSTLYNTVSDDIDSLQKFDVANNAALERSLARPDPLTYRPRVSSLILCIIVAALLITASFTLWFAAVFTVTGQSFEDMVWSTFAHSLPQWLLVTSHFLLMRYVTVGISVGIIVLSLLIAAMRRAWRMYVQLAVFAVVCAGFWSTKFLLKRPRLIYLSASQTNSAPSGHTLLAMAAGIALLLVVPRVLRALVTVLALIFSSLVGVSVISGRWHRPVDVMMAFLFVAASACIAMLFTRKNGMDKIGTRLSSPTIHIIATALLTSSLCAAAYVFYVVDQLLPGLPDQAQWVNAPANFAAFAGIVATSALTCALCLILRQLTACPLTRTGLVGAPPLPPRAQ